MLGLFLSSPRKKIAFLVLSAALLGGGLLVLLQL